jgi:CubicO group peptidase (beta-lactamase class C family)
MRIAHRDQRWLVAAPLLLLAFGCAEQLGRQTSHLEHRRPLPEELVQLTRLLEATPISEDEGDDTPRALGGDRASPVNALRAVRAELRAVDPGAPQPTGKFIITAAHHLDLAWDAFSAGSPDLSHVTQTVHHLARAERALAHVPELGTGLRAELAAIGAAMATNLLAVARRAGASDPRLAAAQAELERGVQAAGANDFHVALAHVGVALNLITKTITFDVELFRQNIAAALAGRTVGHAFGIAYQGQLYLDGDAEGFARTAADSPSTAQSPTKRMHVASVSKTLTAIVTLRALQDLGLSPHVAVAAYLPSNWELGNGVHALTFADFMSHQSGFAQNNVGNAYPDLQAGIAMDVPSTEFEYKNANFGLMRVAVAGLLGIDPADYPEFDAGSLTAAAFILYAQSLYSGIGVDVACTSTDATPTIQYKFPDGGAAGYEEPNRSLTCGGFGWFISANELASVLAHLKSTSSLVDPATRTAMQHGFLGFMDPANYSSGIGVDGEVPGTYFGHGGDWFHTAGEAHTCAMAFPIDVQAGLVINSERGPGMAYQCKVLQVAFDNAWVGS